MTQSYLDLAKQGKNNWWRYLVGTLLILFIWQVLGSAIAIIYLYFVLGVPPQEWAVFFKSPSVGAYITINISFVFLCLAIFLVVRWLHQRKFHTLIGADARVNFKRLLSGFGVWLLLQAILTGVGFLLEPHNYEFTFKPTQWLSLLPLALILTPIQTSAEEFLFRGYLLQGLGCITKKWFLLISISSLLFMLLHLANPELQRGAVWVSLSYFAWGAFFSLVTLKDNRLELALGVHAANNLYVALFTNTKDSALPSPAMWTAIDPGDPKWGLVVFLVQCAVFYYVFFGKKRKLASLTPKASR